eukprot:CAMPEP_0196659234 /NCGR_PEP_ID=MMETSP1086-20130531/33846_1 /TAXON_ID=77921 /ORGANISM="Cyanoptyche  gloeocystis , Strain SAG4.97" /LENGTH=160 /DNA_ID=CAMNT_0041993117 /DNA_START=114 /DNA_END=596 /DNA_ORIENTATION=+
MPGMKKLCCLCSRNKNNKPPEVFFNDPPTCALCLVYEVYYRQDNARGFCKLCHEPVQEGVLCRFCSLRLNACYHCGIEADPSQGTEHWFQIVKAVVAKELKNLEKAPAVTKADDHLRNLIRWEWEHLPRIFQDIFAKNPTPDMMLYLRVEYEKGRRRYLR